MATITKIERREGVVYKARIRIDGRPLLSKTFKNRSDAVKWAKAREVEIQRDDAGLTNEAQRHKLSEAIDRYRREVLPGLRPESARKYKQHLELWEQKLGRLRLSELAAERIAKVRDEIAAEPIQPRSKEQAAGKPKFRSAATINRHLASLAAVLTSCVKNWHWLTVSPMRQVAKATEGDPVTHFLSEEELHRLLNACRESESPDLYLAVLLSTTTGARQGEILGLRWRDVDLDNRVLHLRVGEEEEIKTKNKAKNKTKGGARSVAIVEQVMPMLKARKESQQEADGSALVFPSRVSKRQPVQLRTPWETALKRAGIENFRWHDMRHSWASFAAKGGATLLEIGAVLGHRSTATTKRYAHLTEQHSHSLVRGVADKLLGGGK